MISKIVLTIIFLITGLGVIGYIIRERTGKYLFSNNQQMTQKVTVIPTVSTVQQTPTLAPSTSMPAKSDMPFCLVQNLDVSFSLGSPATGGDEYGGITFKNKGSFPCLLKGVPNVQVFDNNNRKLPLVFTQQSSNNCQLFWHCPSDQTVLLQPQSNVAIGKTYAETPIEWHVTKDNVQGCPDMRPTPLMPLRVQIILPNRGGQLTTSITNSYDANQFVYGNCNPYLIYPFTTDF